MKSQKSELPLVVFTMVSPVAAGFWIVAAMLSLSHGWLGPQTLASAACGFAVLAAIAFALAVSTFHLGKPLSAIRAFARIGNSNVSNEVFMGALLVISLLLYLVVTLCVGEQDALSRIILAISAVSAGFFVLFQCLAYRMRTVETWNSAAFSFESALVAFIGGICLVGLASQMICSLKLETLHVLTILEVILVIVLLVDVYVQGATMVQGLRGKLGRVSSMERWYAMSSVRVALVVLGVGFWVIGMSFDAILCSWVGTIAILSGATVGRFAFYSAYINVGLPQS